MRRAAALMVTSVALGAPPCWSELKDISVTAQSNLSLWNASHRVSNPDWNGDRHVEPLFVALPKSVADVQRSLKCALANNLKVAIKGGGHSFGGYSTIPANEGFMINMVNMAQVSPVSQPGLVTAGAGARWRDVYASFRDSGQEWVVTGGLCPSVGVAGFTMGGGTGPAVRLHGMAIDSVQSFTMVTANGSDVVIASADSNPSLFWALRGGGGGNFGVVTDLTFRVYPGPDVYAWGEICWAWAQVPEVMHALSLFAPKFVETVNVDFVMDTTRGICLWVISMMDLAQTRAALKPLMDTLPAPTNTTLSEMDCWWEMIQAFSVARGYSEYDEEPYYSKNCLVDSIADPRLAQTLVQLAESAPDICEAGHHFISFGGQAHVPLPNSTAFPWRATEYMIDVSCGYSEGSEDQKAVAAAYLNRWMAELTPFCNGGSYLNFIDPLISLQGEAYYGSNLARLSAIKHEWNPASANYPLRFPLQIPG